MKNTKKLIAAGVLMASMTAAIACYVDENYDCPASVTQDGVNCVLSSGTQYPGSKTAEPGQDGVTEHVSDNVQHCTYKCGSTTKSLYYGMTTDPEISKPCKGQ